MVTPRVLDGPVPGVEHALTPLGTSFQRPFAALNDWTVEHMK